MILAIVALGSFAFGLAVMSLIKLIKKATSSSGDEYEPIVGSDGVVILSHIEKDPASTPIGDRAEITKEDQLLLS